MVKTIMQSNKEKFLFWMFISLLLFCVAFYIYCVEETIYNVVARQNIEIKYTQLSLVLGAEESKYISMRNDITLQKAYTLGFKETAQKKFVSRTSVGYVASASGEI